MSVYLKKHKKLFFLTTLLSLITSLAYVFISVLLETILDMATSGDLNGFVRVFLFSLFYFMLLGLFAYLYSLACGKMVCKVINSMRKKIFKKIISRSYADFYSTNTADYLSVITNDIKMVEDNYLLPMLELIQNGVLFIASLIVMFYFDVIIAVSVLAAILIMIIVPNLFGAAMQKRQKQYSFCLSKLTNHIKDMLSGFEVIRSYNIGSYIIAKFGKSNQATTDAKYSVEKIVAANESVSMLLALLMQIVVIFLSAYFIVIGRTTVGIMMGMMQVSGTIFQPLLMIFENIPKFKSVQPVIERINKFSDYEDSGFVGTVIPKFEKGLSATNLTFSYNGKNQVLKDVSIEINKGKKYALVGKSGCGKTTFVKLLTGFYSGYQGSIQYDDFELTELNYRELTKLVATIHQNVYMFNESIYDNICLHHQYTEGQIARALEISGVSHFANKMPDGLDTIVEENGDNLSGGQKQRIAVARAIIQSKPILVLDEGTSNIDMQTAYDIESRLLDIEGLTLITITHNLREDILIQYDKIISMEDGKIIAVSSFNDWVERGIIDERK